ncbi:MAG: hypothetical protein U0174_09465 [Polyangiaceae bacterium]
MRQVRSLRLALSTFASLAALLLAARARADVPPPPLPEPTPPPPAPEPEPAPPRAPELSAPSPYAESESDEPPARAISAAYYTGFRWGLSPGVVFTSSGSAAFALSIYAGYGIDTGSVIFVPGLTLASVFTPNTFLYATPELRVVYPIGVFAPFVTGGVGPGFTTSPSQAALVVRGGGGFTVHPSAKFAIGIEGGYVGFVGLGGGGPYVGPILSFAF